MYVVILEFDSLADAYDAGLDELRTMCMADTGEPIMQTQAAATGLQLYFENVTSHKGKYEVYKLEKI